MVKLKKLIKSEKGQSMPLVTIIIGLFALGFMALVIDAGFLYVERKAEITSADAAALAGAQVLLDSKGLNVSEAKTTAENYAIANGSDSSQIQVFVGIKSITLPNGTPDTRQVVEVTVGKNKPSIFARFLGDESTDVKADAMATWGYRKRSSYCPIFIFNTAYKLDTNITLHDNVSVIDNETALKTTSYGFIQVGAGEGMTDIKKAIEGTITTEPVSVGDNLNGAPGKRESVYDSAVKRIGDTVIIPIINWQAFSTDTDNLDKDGSIIKNSQNWQLPVMYFAYFKITNVIQQNEKGIDSVKIEGQFTGKTVDSVPVVEEEDQINPNPSGDQPAAYSKLIK